ncbi:MAG TPA: NAD(P)H-hydrate dehydratase [Flavisolibacter sp.]|nr:NAD(P)H-hydrate dehydratase [Flavisolibacter sp.]
MNIYTAQQLRAWDAYTIEHEPISSLGLMERAAAACVGWIGVHDWKDRNFIVICGKGNNGGDGLAIARLLLARGYRLSVYVLATGKPGSPDFEANLKNLHPAGIVKLILSTNDFPPLREEDMVIDAMFGSGLQRPLEGLAATLAAYLNRLACTVISIDLPSGLFMDGPSAGEAIVHASYTLTFQAPKLALLVQDNASYIGDVHVLDIGLHPGYPEQVEPPAVYVKDKLVRQIYRPRPRFAHKGHFGHALLIAGSHGKSGAALLAARACLGSGAGLLTCSIPADAYIGFLTALPEAMVLTGNEAHGLKLPDSLDTYTALGIGPGLGQSARAQEVMVATLRNFRRPMVIDADGLNCLSLRPGLLKGLVPMSILTPHPREFDRLFGENSSSFDRIAKAVQKAKELRVVIVLKGHHSLIVTPEGKMYFNSTGNAGMAKGGSGDVLTGMLTALLSQGYASVHAAILGVFLHGLAGDLAAEELGREAMLASDIIAHLGHAFNGLQ